MRFLQSFYFDYTTFESELELEDKIIELADYFISENTTYREAKIACEKLFRQVSHEIELRALESKIRGNDNGTATC
ncbi:hypothetical protein STYK_11300 [Streptococcus toyakuensis]|uniref:Phage protein n=1 Tax=Streptococcus toyakuensis TaxID=2819619 RepID=A0ABN6KL44_9STRE|nr:hypothetical protein STYK_11300 [Streptococcus toyakuensis]